MGRYSKHFSNCRMAGVVRSKRQWRDVLVPEMEAWCRRNKHSFKATDEVFTVASSKGGVNRISRVIANDRTSIDTIMGLTLAGAYVDEAPKMSPDFLQALDGRLRVPGAKMVMSFNPEGGPRHWFYDTYIRDAADKNIDYHRVLLADNANPSLPENYYSDLKARYPAGHLRARLLDGEWVAAMGQIWDIDDNIKKPPARVPDSWDVAIDVGTATVTCALLVGNYGAAGSFVEDIWYHDAVQSGYRVTVADQWPLILEYFRPRGNINRWVVDEAAADMAVHVDAAILSGELPGRRVVSDKRVKMGEDQVAYYLSQYYLHISPHPKTEPLRADIDNYIYDEDKSLTRGVELAVDGGSHHYCAALRYWGMMDATEAYHKRMIGF